MGKSLIVLILVIGLALGGCAGMSQTEQRTLSGGAMGAGAGFLYGKHKEGEQRAYQQGYQAGRSSQ